MPLNKDSFSLSEFRQIPFQKSEVKLRQTHGIALSVSDIGDSFLAKLKKKAGGERGIIAKNWAKIVPEKFASRSVPERVHMGVLYVRVQNSAVKQEMTFLKRSILAKIVGFEVCKSIKDLRFL